MPYDAIRATYESRLAAAHKAVWRAQQSAEALGDREAHDDLYEIMLSLGRLQTASLKGKTRRSVLSGPRAQQPLPLDRA